VRAGLVLVSGAPGVGKTTLARMLASDLSMALLSKDTVKESLGETMGAESVERSQDLGRAAVRVLYDLAREQLTFGVPVVVESGFHQANASEVEPLVELAPSVLIHCHAPNDVVAARTLGRAGERHGVHFDAERLPFDTSAYGVMELDVPVMFVDTADGYNPDYPTVIDFVERGARRS
jgi:predicted kinase